MPVDITLREMTLSDGAAINALARRCPDGGAVSVVSVFRENAFESLEHLRPNSMGLAAESPRHEGLAGMGWVSFGHCRIEDQQVPYALLHSFMVHPERRRQGIAEALSYHAISTATARLGNRVLIMGDIQADNAPSHAWARKWSNQALSTVTVVPVTVQKRKPGLLPEINFGRLETDHVEAFVRGLNRFYSAYNLFQPETAESLWKWLSHKPLGLSMRHCLIATDRHGQLLAGLVLEEAHRLRTYQVGQMPPVLGLANRLLHVIPADGIIREILVSRFWFKEGEEGAARCLWQQARWECRHRGTSLMAFFDPRSPLAHVFSLKPWSIHTAMTPVIRRDTPVSPGRPICPIP